MRSVCILVTAVALTALSARPSAAPASLSAADAIRAAVLQRVGQDADVTISSIDRDVAGLNVREARPDPNARFGKPMKFSLVMSAGAALPVTAVIDVVATHLVARQAVERGHTVDASSIEERRTVLAGMPIGRPVTRAEALGARALRPIAQGAILLPADLALRRLVEAGQSVTVVAIAGPVEVSATLVAADGGAIGDVIRLKNPDTRRFIRGRIVKAGDPHPIVEVINER